MRVVESKVRTKHRPLPGSSAPKRYRLTRAAIRSHSQQDEQPKKIGILGYDVSAMGAALALILSICSLIWQVLSFAIGPDVRALPMRGVELTCSKQDGTLCTQNSNLIDRKSVV